MSEKLREERNKMRQEERQDLAEEVFNEYATKT